MEVAYLCRSKCSRTWGGVVGVQSSKPVEAGVCQHGVRTLRHRGDFPEPSTTIRTLGRASNHAFCCKVNCFLCGANYKAGYGVAPDTTSSMYLYDSFPKKWPSQINIHILLLLLPTPRVPKQNKTQEILSSAIHSVLAWNEM